MKLKLAIVSVFAVFLTACDEPEPEPVYLSPQYDKYGSPSCADGYQLATTEGGQTVCAPL